MKKKQIVLFLMVVTMTVVLTGCMPGDSRYTVENPAGFFWGIWHGWIAPFSLIFGLFNHSIKLYEINNIGWWYDFGFYIAIIAGFGSARLTRMSKKKRD